MAKTIFLAAFLWLSSASAATASVLHDAQHCKPLKIWGAPEINCVDWSISSSDRELTVFLQRRASNGEVQPVHEFRLYTHYLSARVEWLPLFNSGEKTLSTLSEGETGSSVSQTIWALVGFPQGKCKPYLVESLNAQHSIFSHTNDLRVSRQIVRHGKTPRIVLAYRLIQKDEGRRARIHRWRDTLAWDGVQQRFVLQKSTGDHHQVRANIHAAREKRGAMTCEHLRTAGAETDFGLTSILEEP